MGRRKRKVKDESLLTPYQGNRRCFGEFECQKCDRKWSSAYSWANTSQKCDACHTNVYPYHQRKLLSRKGGSNNNKPHRKDLCGMCQKLGSCVEKSYIQQKGPAPGS